MLYCIFIYIHIRDNNAPIYICIYIYIFHSIYYCNKCGSYATNKLRKLAQQCDKKTEAGSLFLSNIDKGILPKVDNIPLTLEEQTALASVHDFVQDLVQQQPHVEDPIEIKIEKEFSPESPRVDMSDSD